MARAQDRGIRVALAWLLVALTLFGMIGCAKQETQPVDTPVPIPSAEPTEPIVPAGG